MRSRRFVLLAPFGLAGCAPSMQLQVPPAVVATQWSEPLSLDGAPVAAEHGLGRALASAELSDLIERALRRNPDIGIAAARVDQARALLRLAKAEARPSVTLSADAGAVSDRSAARVGQGEVTLGLDVAYDLDLFGGAAANRRASRSRLAASEHERQAVLVVVEAETARTYLTRAALAKRIALVDRSIAQAAELERIIRARVEAGEANLVDLGQQSTRVTGLRAERVRLDLAFARTRTALAVLCGEEAPLFQSAAGDLDQLSVPTFAGSDPQALLERRPDIRASEALIAAAGGDVASARAAFFPRLRLSAGAFLQSASGGPLDALLSVGAGLLAPIFDRSRLRGDYDLATARQRESVEVYRRTLLTAFAEVENARAAAIRAQSEEELVRQMVEEARRTARLSRLQYVEGEADLRDTLDAEERLIAAEDALAVARQQRLEAAVDLFRATGGRLA